MPRKIKNSKKTKDISYKPGPASRKKHKEQQEKSEQRSHKPEEENNNIATDEIPEKYRKYYIPITLEQFIECSNITEVLSNETKKRYPDSRLSKLSNFIQEVHANYRLCPLYRKNPIFADLKFEPKPWLTKKDKELLLKKRIGSCSVDMGSNNIVKYIENRGIQQVTQKGTFKGYQHYNFDQYIQNTFKKKVEQYGGLDIACERLMHKLKKQYHYIAKDGIVAKTSPKSGKTDGKKNFIDKNNKIARKFGIAKPCPMSRKPQEAQIAELTNYQDREFIATGRLSPLSQVAKERAIENKNNADIMDKNKEITTKSVFVRPCPMSRKRKEMQIAELNMANCGLAVTEHPSPLSRIAKQVNNITNLLGMNNKTSKKSLIAKPCPMSRKPTEVQVADFNNKNIHGELLATDRTPALLSEIASNSFIGNEVENDISFSPLFRKRTKNKSERENKTAETLTSEDSPSSSNMQYHIIPSTSKGNFCGQKSRAIVYTDDSSSDDVLYIPKRIRTGLSKKVTNIKLNENVNNEECDDIEFLRSNDLHCAGSTVQSRKSIDIVLSEAQPIFVYSSPSTENSNHLWEDKRNLRSSKKTKISRSKNAKFPKPVIELTSDGDSQDNSHLFLDNAKKLSGVCRSVSTSTTDLNEIIARNRHLQLILRDEDKFEELLKRLKRKYPDCDDEYLINKCLQLFRYRLRIIVKDAGTLKNVCKSANEMNLLSACNKIQEGNAQPLIIGNNQNSLINTPAIKENDQIIKNADLSKKPEKKIHIISNEVLKTAFKPGESSISFNNIMEFEKYTNIEEYLKQDIMKKFPNTYNKYLPKIKKLIDRFYKTYILNQKIWPPGLIVNASYIHKDILIYLATDEIIKDSGADEMVVTKSVQLPTIHSVMENYQDHHKENSVVLEDNTTTAKQLTADKIAKFKTFQKQLTCEQLINCTEIVDYLDKTVLSKCSALIGKIFPNISSFIKFYYEGDFKNMNFWPEGLQLNYDGVEKFFNDQKCQINKNMSLNHSSNESRDRNSEIHNHSADLFPSSNETNKSGNCQNNIMDINNVAQTVEIRTTPFSSASSSSYLEKTQDHLGVPTSQSSSSTSKLKNLRSGNFPMPIRSHINYDDENIELEIKTENLESNTDTLNKDNNFQSIPINASKMGTTSGSQINNYSSYTDDVEIIDNSIHEPIIIDDDPIETAEDILSEMCNIVKSPEIISNNLLDKSIERESVVHQSVLRSYNNCSIETQSPIDQSVFNDVEDKLNQMFQSQEVISYNVQNINMNNNVLSESKKSDRPSIHMPESTRNQNENVVVQKENIIPDKKKSVILPISSNSKLPAANSDFVPQTRHNFGELEFISKTKFVNTRKRRKSCSSETKPPKFLKLQQMSNKINQVDIEDPDYCIEDTSGIRNISDKICSQNKAMSDTQLLNDDNTYFMSTLILAASESSATKNKLPIITEIHNWPPRTTSQIIAANEINQNFQPTEPNIESVKDGTALPLQLLEKPNYDVNKIYRQVNSKIFVYITYLSLYEVKFDKKLNSLLYENSVPFLQPFEKQPIQSTILFRSIGFNKLNIIGDSLKLILGFNDNEWKCLLNILQIVGTFEYCINDPEPRGKSLPFRILYLFFKSLPHFAQITLEIVDTNINHAKCVKFSTNFYEPYANLVDVFSPSILQIMAKAKSELCNKNV